MTDAPDAPTSTVYLDNLLALDVIVETRRLAKRCEDYRLDDVGPGDFRLVHVDDFRAMDRLTHAILLQGAERLATATPESDCSRTLEVEENGAFLLLAMVRPNAPGPIRLTLGGRTRLIDVAFGRAAFVQQVLLLPGMMYEREPANAILLGRRLSPREALICFANGATCAPVAETRATYAPVAETQPEETGDTK